MSRRRVTLLSDFGSVDGYAAAMAGVIAAAASDAFIEHASHQVPPGDVLTAALTLSRYAFLYPEGTVHLVVVDPGVGTERRAIAASIRRRLFVAPDNGVLTRVLSADMAHMAGTADTAEEADSGTQVVEIGGWAAPGAGSPGRAPPPRTGRPSTTFHGRDIFAPAAARLVSGEPLEALGSAVDDPVLLPLPAPIRTSRSIEGEVIQVDRFGNLITNVPGDWLTERRLRGESPLVRVADTPAALRATYGDVEPGDLLAVIGSLGLVEVSVRDGSAADRLRAGRGAPVRVRI